MRREVVTCGVRRWWSAERLQGLGGASFDVGVAAGGGGGSCRVEADTGPLFVAGLAALEEHLAPCEVDFGGQVGGAGAFGEGGGAGEVVVGLLVAAQQGGELAEVVAARR